MTEYSALYDFCGARLRIEADDSAFDQAFKKAFGAFLRTQEGASDDPVFGLSMRSGQPIAPDGLPFVWRGDLPEGGTGLMYETDGRCVLMVDRACLLDIRSGASSASVVIAPGGLRRFMGSASMLMLDFALRAFRRQLVHAACLVNPVTGGAVLIFAPSGSGKTSTSIALARGGFRIMTDDASVLDLTQSRVHAWGLPRGLKVHRKTADLMSWLQPLVGADWDANGEQAVALSAIEPHIALAPPVSAVVEAVVVLGARRDGTHRLECIPKSDALLEMAADNVPWRRSGAPAHSTQTFEALAHALLHAAAFRLNAGPDLASLPDLFHEALKSPNHVAP